MARQSVVVISVQYRLGVTGFLSLEGAPDNRALHDLLLALDWIHENAARFGGDAHQLTLFGSSAGAIAVGALVASPLARGKLTRAIVQSGNLHCAHDREAAAVVRAQFFEELGGTRTLEELSALPLEELLRAQRTASQKLEGVVGGAPYQPLLGDAVLPQAPLQAIEAGAAREVSLMVGTNLDEARLLALRDLLADDFSPEQLSAHCKTALGCDDELLAQLLDVQRSGSHRSLREVWYQIATEVYFHMPALQLLEAQRQAGGQAYGYLLARRAPGMDGLVGACHALEIPLVFGTYEEPLAAALLGELEQVAPFSKNMQNAWGSFARRGAPGWEPYGPTGAMMVFDEPESASRAQPLGAVWERWAPHWSTLQIRGVT